MYGGGAFSRGQVWLLKVTVMKTLLSALAVVMLLGAATAAPANAYCYRGAYGVLHCTHYWHPWYHPWRGW